MTLSASSIESSRLLWAHNVKCNQAAFDRYPVGAVFNVVSRTRQLVAILGKVGADTVSDVGQLKTVDEAGFIRGDVRLELVSVPVEAERFEQV